MEANRIKLIECPRDAMQGIHQFIPTSKKIAYINQLLKTGFDVVDFGSFVSPKAIPQLRDTEEVLSSLDLSSTDSKLLAIVANYRGARAAAGFPEIDYVGYPFSISETFQQRNTNATIAESHDLVRDIQALCLKNNKELVVYLSMGFGNPYGDPWNAEIVHKWIACLHAIGVRMFALSDTIGVSNPENISYLFEWLIPAFPGIELGAHLHSLPGTIEKKLQAALDAGCRRFDGALNGFGGCPMARDELTGNMPTEKMIDYLDGQGFPLRIDRQALGKSLNMAAEIFGVH